MSCGECGAKSRVITLSTTLMKTQAIIECIDRYLEKNNLPYINPVEAGALLARAGILADSSLRPGLPLRNYLRKGKIPHAYQLNGKGSGWVIPHSDGSGKKMVKPTGPIKRSVAQKIVSQPCEIHDGNFSKLEKELMNPAKQRSVGEIDHEVPNEPGMYCIRITNPDKLPKPFARIIRERGHNIIYIGIASRSLKRRLLGQELRARGHGTFFRSMGALLGYLPPAGSLVGKGNQRNYKFSASDNAKIIDWMNKHLTVHWMPCTSGMEMAETQLIGKYLPLINISKNPSALAELSLLRKKCVDVACGR